MFFFFNFKYIFIFSLQRPPPPDFSHCSIWESSEICDCAVFSCLFFGYLFVKYFSFIFFVLSNCNLLYCRKIEFELKGKRNWIGALNRSCLCLFIVTQDIVSYKPIIYWALSLSVYTVKPVCRSTFETPWDKLPNLLGMKLTTDVTLIVTLIYLFILYFAGVDYETNWINEFLLYYL